jgi:hypothetical protein
VRDTDAEEAGLTACPAAARHRSARLGPISTAQSAPPAGATTANPKFTAPAGSATTSPTRCRKARAASSRAPAPRPTRSPAGATTRRCTSTQSPTCRFWYTNQYYAVTSAPGLADPDRRVPPARLQLANPALGRREGQPPAPPRPGTAEPTHKSAGRPAPGSDVLAGRRGSAADQALQQPGFTWPGGDQHLAGHLPSGVPQGERNHQHVVQRADHWQELR